MDDKPVLDGLMDSHLLVLYKLELADSLFDPVLSKGVVEHVIREETMLAMYDLKSTSTDMSDMSFNSGVRIHGLRGATTSMLIRQEREYWRSMQKYKGVDIMSMVTLLGRYA
ncbi:hypothetical protein Tco_0805032 [Tanacetum coccineum]